MHAYKIIAFAAATALFAGCNGFGNIADVREVEDLKKELKETKESQQALQKQYIAQNEEMTAILAEISEVTGQTASLKLDVENGSARMTQAERISASIESLKARVAALEKSNKALTGKNKNFSKMVEEFNKVIESQELQINTLKEEIQSKDKTIRAQKDTISSQNSTIEGQRNDLKALVAKQAKSLCEAGQTLEEIADNAPQVSWKKNKTKVSDMAQTMYRKALEYYQESLSSGYEAAQEHIESVSAKIK